MPVNIKVVYITKYNKKFILNKPDNFAYYIKSIMNSNLIDVHLLNPLPLQKNNSIQTLIALVKTIKDINPDILYLDNLQGLNKLVVLKRVGILKCKIVAWKYTYCKEYSNSIKNWFTKFFYWQEKPSHEALPAAMYRIYKIPERFRQRKEPKEGKK